MCDEWQGNNKLEVNDQLCRIITFDNPGDETKCGELSFESSR